MGFSMAEKILARASGRTSVRAGEYVDARIDGLMAYQTFVDAQQAAIRGGLAEGISRIWDPAKFFLMIEHNQPAASLRQAERQQRLREFARTRNLPHFLETLGICHQIMVDKGYALPGQLVVGSDSHCIMYGAVNCASTGIGETEVAFAVTTGELWFMVPETLKLQLIGTPPAWPIGKDVMLHLAGRHGADFALYKSIEVSGSGAAALSMDNRFTIADHGIEVGAKFVLFEHDEKTRAFLTGKATGPFNAVSPDPDASYVGTFTVDLSKLAPQVAAPHHFDNVRPLDDLAGTRIDQANIGSCANGRFEDIAIAARILKGRKVHSRVRLLVSPASWDVYKQCLAAGLPEVIVDAGGQFLDPGCGVCTTTRSYLAPGEVCLTATTRNHRGRMGSPEALIYLAGPATVAWSAVVGAIADPREVLA